LKESHRHLCLVFASEGKQPNYVLQIKPQKSNKETTIHSVASQAYMK